MKAGKSVIASRIITDKHAIDGLMTLVRGRNQATTPQYNLISSTAPCKPRQADRTPPIFVNCFAAFAAFPARQAAIASLAINFAVPAAHMSCCNCRVDFIDRPTQNAQETLAL